MSASKNLIFRIGIGIFISFIFTLMIIWCVYSLLANQDANRKISLIVEDVEWQIGHVLRWSMQGETFEFRDAINAMEEVNRDGLKKIASEFRVKDVTIVNDKGDVICSTLDNFLSQNGKKMLNIRDENSEFYAFAILLDSRNMVWHYQAINENPMTGELDAKVGIWLPNGGIAIISYSDRKLRDMIHSLLIWIFSDWHEGDNGGVVLTTKNDLIIADYKSDSRKGDRMVLPGNDCYWIKQEYLGFYIYVILPKEEVLSMRNGTVGIASGLNLVSLVITSILVSLIVARFVRLRIKAQNAKEMQMARDIQMAFLPNSTSHKINDTRVKLFASMETSKDVGGDFYDYYLLPSDKIFFAIADVSGKGVPAAMFMMRTKAVVKALVDKGLGVSQILEQTNQLLCDGNISNTFVTMWIGILNLKTGELTYSSAGHNPPIIKQNNEAYYLKMKNGLVLGAMSKAKYPELTLQLQRGDIIYLYTDGITEQRNKEGKLYGEKRLLQFFNGGNINEKTVLKEVYDSVVKFADEVEQNDDCTQMVLRYRGENECLLERKYLLTLEGITEATNDLKSTLSFMPQKEQLKTLVAADEILANIMNYSEANEWTMKISKIFYPNGIALTFTDDGHEFDPIGVGSPDVTLSADKRKIGGNGLLIVKKRMTSVAYVRKKGYNILDITLEYEA